MLDGRYSIAMLIFDYLPLLSLAAFCLLVMLLIYFIFKLNQWHQSHHDQSTHVKAFLEQQQLQANHIGHFSSTIDQKLSSGLGETKSLYISVIKRLALIEQTQQTLQQISHHIIDLEKVLKHPQKRGAYGEIQLQHIVDNCIPPAHRTYQMSLSNGRRADCIIHLACPPHHLAIDAKFPLANFDPQTHKDSRQFKQDLKTHIDAIAEKYIVAGETVDHAIMFIPAEGIFHHICEHHADIVELAHKKRVWVASPTTLLALLHISMSTIRDQQLQQHIGFMKDQLAKLDVEFERFDKRIDASEKHIALCYKDIHEVQATARKISKSFRDIRSCDDPTLQDHTVVVSQEPTD